MAESALLTLECAELEAREARLAAADQAERIQADARERAGAIEAQVPGRIAAAIEEVRRREEARAAAEIHDLELELAALEASAAVPVSGRAFDEAVALIVAAVLGETDGSEGPS